ncbi:MAG: enoyl-CoA hydratase/isomerase family protein [Candidatus Lambdaproteobacteria bacterium]|nr:enoyl-CoA hydratase/isomerase family protein [Candidatus Lambdaproteobacteria bacterium]
MTDTRTPAPLERLRWETLRLEGSATVRHVVLNRPRVLNAMNDRMKRDLHDVMGKLDLDPACRVVIVRGEGRSFCSGADLKEGSVNPTSSVARLMRRSASGKRMRELIGEMAPITIAAVHGHCIGAGAALAAACDFRIAAESASLAIKEVPVGLTFNGVIADTVHLVGVQHARELLIFGEAHPAGKLLDWGYWDQVVPDDQLVAAAQAFAERLLAVPPIPAQLTKLSIAAMVRALDRPVFHADPAGFALSARSKDTSEARRRRAPGEAPRWQFE